MTPLQPQATLETSEHDIMIVAWKNGRVMEELDAMTLCVRHSGGPRVLCISPRPLIRQPLAQALYQSIR